MKTALLLMLLPFLLFAADVKIPVQGFLADSEGKIVTGNKSITFSLYNSDSSEDLIWSETASLDIKDSMFSHMLGTVEYLDSASVDIDTPLFLEIIVENEKLTPRIELGVEAKAIFSYNSGKFDGKTFSEAKKDIKDEIKLEIGETDLTSILSRLDSLETTITNLQTENSTLLTKIDTLEINISNLLTENSTLTTKVTTLETKVNSLESNVITLQTENSTLTTKVNSLESNSFDGDYNSLLNKPTLFSGSYNDLTDRPILHLVATSGNYNDLTDKPTLHLVATTGRYSDLSDLPSLFDGDYNNLINKPVLATVATSGSYSDLEDKPTTITQEQADAIADNTTDITSLKTRATNLETKTASISTLTDNGQPTVRFSGVNVQIVSGSGATGGAINGRGNLIVGYNEARTSGSNKSGSHNLIIGTRHNYTNFGGAVIGYQNSISGEYSSITGGSWNTASGDFSSVSGGDSNRASGYRSSVSGGHNNIASSQYSSVNGGSWNTASGEYSSVSGGNANNASGYESSVSGGMARTASGNKDWVAGALLQDN